MYALLKIQVPRGDKTQEENEQFNCYKSNTTFFRGMKP